MLVVAGGLAIRSGLSPGAGPGQPLTVSGSPAASATGTTSSAVVPAAPAVTLGGFTFTPPAGYAQVGKTGTSNQARFGPEGLLNDGEPLGPHDMRVVLRTVALASSTGGGRLWITQILPRPTAAHPGPRPAPDPTDDAAATRTIMDVERAGAAGKGSVAEVGGLPVGPAVLVKFDDHNGQLVARPDGVPAQVLLLESGAAPVDLLVETAASAHR